MLLLLRSSSGKKIDFFVFEDILMGPIPFFLTFRAELKKISKKIIRPIFTDSTGNFGFGHDDGEGPHTQ